MKIYTIEETKCIIIDGELWVRFEEAFPDNVEEGEEEEERERSVTTRKKNGRAPKWDTKAEIRGERPKGQKKCGKCGEPGHQARTCGRETDVRMSQEEASPAFRSSGITEEQFDQVKALQEDGQNSMAIARDTGIPLVQIGRMMNSDDYEEYLGKA